MSEDRFAGLDLDDNFGADYVAKKQEPEPAKDEVVYPTYGNYGNPYLRPGTANNDINPYSQLAFGGTTNQYINTTGGQYKNALGGLIGPGSGLNNYVAPSPYLRDPSLAATQMIEWDALMDRYRVKLVRNDGTVELVVCNGREEAYDFANLYYKRVI